MIPLWIAIPIILLPVLVGIVFVVRMVRNMNRTLRKIKDGDYGRWLDAVKHELSKEESILDVYHMLMDNKDLMVKGYMNDVQPEEIAKRILARRKVHG